jgi:hypothetical protein
MAYLSVVHRLSPVDRQMVVPNDHFRRKHRSKDKKDGRGLRLYKGKREVVPSPSVGGKGVVSDMEMTLRGRNNNRKHCTT